MHAQLQPGTLLDERYRIDAVLGQGGFGITYAAENTRIGMKVAVKELFWRGHSVRAEGASPELALENVADAPVFEAQKQRFLREARTIRDFSGQPGVVGILDYFEANGTAYIVMEYVEGETLAARSAAGKMPCEDLLRRFLPIIDTLAAIHRTGIIHRDISPENIMVQPDGSLKLIDFGAARQYRGEDGHYTAISRDSYSPGEQYDKNGRQGPWTDVYALCATIYACVCGAPPQGAVQRLFLDELKAPSALGVDILPAYEAILMKGLQLRPEKRWQDMDALGRAIREALPAEKPPANNRRGLLIGMLAGLLCAALAVGIWSWRRYDATHKFRGIETELIRFAATRDTTAAEFANAQDELRTRLEDFAGKENYLLDVKGDSIWVTLPLACFDNREIPVVIDEKFGALIPGKEMKWWYDFKGVWEDPAHSMFAGRNQVLPDKLEGATIEYLYKWNETLTGGQRANLIVDFKTRLDALGVPYAFGTSYGNEDVIAYRIGLDRTGPFVENTLPQYSPLKIGNEIHDFITISSSDHLEAVDTADGDSILRFSLHSDYDIEKLEEYTRASLEAAINTICLQDNENNSIARTIIEEPITDGKLAFQDFTLEGIDTIDGDNSWLADYLDALIYQSDLPTSLYASGWEYIDAEGNPHLDNKLPDFGIKYVDASNRLDEWRQSLREICQTQGCTLDEDTNGFWINFDMALDDTLPQQVEKRVPALLEALRLNDRILPKRLYLCLTEETTDLWCRVYLYPGYDYDNKRFENVCDLLVSGKAVEPWANALQAWWDDFDCDALGLSKSNF